MPIKDQPRNQPTNQSTSQPTHKMPESLSTVLYSHPYKKLDCLKIICSRLKLNSNGTVSTLRERILEHVNDDASLEELVRDIAIKFKQDEAKKNFPISPRVQVLQSDTPVKRTRLNQVQSQDLFSSPNPCDTGLDTQGEHERSILDDIDEVYQMIDEISRCEDNDEEDQLSDTPVPQQPLTSYSHSNQASVTEAPSKKEESEVESLKSSVSKLEFLVTQAIETVAAKDSQIEQTEASLATAMSSMTMLMRTYDENMVSIRREMHQLKQEINSNFLKALEETRVLRVEASTHIEAMLSESSVKLDAALAEVERTGQSLLQGQEELKRMSNARPPSNNNPSSNTSNSNNARSNNTNSSSCDYVARSTTSSSCNYVAKSPTANKPQTTSSDGNGIRRSKTSSNSSNRSNPSNSNQDSSNSTRRTSTSTSGSSSSAGSSTSSSGSSSSSSGSGGSSSNSSSDSGSTSSGGSSSNNNNRGNSNSNQSNSSNSSRNSNNDHVLKNDDGKDIILLIGDSNTNLLVPNMLHGAKHVVIEKRFRLDDAKCNIPKVQRPHRVSDVVMLTGINDVKHPNASIQENILKTDATCQAYSSAFPRARIHIGSIAPSNRKHSEFNAQLKGLAMQRNAPFIAIDQMYDMNGCLRPKMVNGIHYTDAGVKILAKQIKRSLYGSNRPEPSGGANQHPNTWPSTQANSLPLMHQDPRQEIANFLSMAMARLGRC